MSNEISQEAQASIAKLNQRKARDRLARDGAHSNDALRRRVRAFAEERNLPPADIAKLMYKRINTRDVMLFCEKHKVSHDWLLCGDLRGLQRMTKEGKVTPDERVEAQRKEIMQLFSALPPENADPCTRLHAGPGGRVMKRRRRTARKRNRQRLAAHARRLRR